MKVLFAGPSLSGEIEALKHQFPAIDFRPPAACGDILRAVQDGATTIGLIDGYFGDLPSVWHKEILYALHEGVQIGGGASMGALRAAECSAFGMVGIGGIHKDYVNGLLIDDEAVALVHAPQELGWLPLSVPWVDFEPTVTALYTDAIISNAERKRLLLAGRFLHFSNRTYGNVVTECAFGRKGRREHILSALRQRKVERKRADAKAVVGWLNGVTIADRACDWKFMSTSHWELLRSEVTGGHGVAADRAA